MKMTFTAIALSLASLAASAAPTYVYDFTFDGTTTTTNATAAGNQLQNGQSVGMTLRAAGNDFFRANATWGVWAPILMGENATRIGDLTFTFWLDGIAVGSGSYSAQAHTYVHLANSAPLAMGTAFDVFSWEFTLVSSDSATNTMNSVFSTSNPTLGTTVYERGQAIPEPSSLLLLAAAVGGLWARRRIAKA